MCPVAITYKLDFITSKDHERRCVAFLISSDSKLRALAAFRSLRANEKRRLLTRFDHWCAGVVNTKAYHGWNKSEFSGRYDKCFVFKGNEGGSQLRLYGFLIHPECEKRPRFVLCVLTDYAYKKTNATDPKDLERTEQLRTDPRVIEAIKTTFGE
jgi:hypothetical protein